MSEKKVEVLQFDSINIPQPTESVERSNETYVVWDRLTNNYGAYLLKLFNDSPIHSSIVNSKANYIIGDGLRYKGGVDINVKVNAADTFNELIGKLVKEYLIFNAFAVEVVYNQFKVPIEWHFVPVWKIRTNNTKTKFWVSDNWVLGQKPIKFDIWKSIPKDTTSKIFYFDGYNPSINNVYPTPEYHGCITSIETDIEIRNFNLNNISNEFSPSQIISFFNGGTPGADAQKDAYNSIKKSYTGSTGQKFILEFLSDTGKAAEVKNLAAGDWDKKYSLVAASVKDDIMQGHQVTSPMLFGVKVEGQLGGSTEMEVAYEIFQNTYVRNKRNELLSAFTSLFSGGDIVKGELEFAEKQLFNARISEATKEKIYTLNELRAEAGLPALPDGDKLLADSAKPVSTTNFSKDTNNVFQLSEEDFEKIKDLGIVSDEFEFIADGDFVTCKEDFNRIELKFDTQEDVAKYILDNKINGNVKDLRTAIRKDLGINVSVNELKDILTNISDAGIEGISVDESGKVNVSEPEQPSRTIEVMYSYDVRPGYGAPIIDTTRPFCKKLVENNRYYSRQEVQTMSEIFGYDIYSYGGGYYRDPATKQLTSHCRHWFKSVTVSRKKR